MTPAGHRGVPYAAALALLAGITVATAAWSGLGPLAVTTQGARAAEVVAEVTELDPSLLGSDGRYTILFLGSDKRCRKMHSRLGAERCSSLESNVAAASAGGAPASALYPYIWSRAADAKLNKKGPFNRAGTERTDVMTLLTVNPETGEAAALSIPRDMENFPLKPSLAGSFCRPGQKRFNSKVNALFVYAQLCMKKTPDLRAWERSSLAAEKVRENLAYAFQIEIDDWVLTTFGTADILGAKLDTLAPGSTLVHLDDKSRFASCRTNRIRTGNNMSYDDGNISSNAKYGDLLFLRPGNVDRKGSGWNYANCREPGTKKTVRSTSPNFIAGSCSTTSASADGCIFNVPSNLWTGFARARKYDGDTSRIRRAQRILSAISLRVIDAGSGVASALAALASMRWYAWGSRNAAGVVKDWNLGPALVRGSIAPGDVATIFSYVATAREELAAGPDDPDGWRSMLLLGQTVTPPGGRRCRIAGASLFEASDSKSRRTCTRDWVATEFGAVGP